MIILQDVHFKSVLFLPTWSCAIASFLHPSWPPNSGPVVRQTPAFSATTQLCQDQAQGTAGPRSGPRPWPTTNHPLPFQHFHCPRRPSPRPTTSLPSTHVFQRPRSPLPARLHLPLLSEGSDNQLHLPEEARDSAGTESTSTHPTYKTVYTICAVSSKRSASDKNIAFVAVAAIPVRKRLPVLPFSLLKGQQATSLVPFAPASTHSHTTHTVALTPLLAQIPTIPEPSNCFVASSLHH